MITLCIQYELEHNKLSDFERYAKNWPKPIRRCGGDLLGYFLPTRLAGRTNLALALIRFSDLTAYEKYREALMKDPDAIANVKQIEAAGAIVYEDRSFLRQIPE